MSLRGATFKLKGQPDDCFHLWIVVGKERMGRVLAINITDEKWSPDSPCKIRVGDHPQITKKCVAFYRKAREFGAASVAKNLASQIALTKYANASEELLRKIEDGASSADDFTNRFLSYL